MERLTHTPQDMITARPVEKPRVPERNVSPELKAVALHEMGHALIAFSEGVSVDLVSVIPNQSKGYKGVTKLSYVPADAYKLQKIAAGGSLFSPEGNGSDMYTIDMLHAHGGQSRESVMSSAMSFKNMLSSAEWDKVAEIVAHRLEIKGSEIPEIIAQARYEIQLASVYGTNSESSYAGDVFQSWINHTQDATEKALADTPRESRITTRLVDEELPNGVRVSYEVTNGAIVDKSVDAMCVNCGGTEAHADTCSTKHINLRSEVDKIIRLPQNAVIFD